MPCPTWPLTVLLAESFALTPAFRRLPTPVGCGPAQSPCLEFQGSGFVLSPDFPCVFKKLLIFLSVPLFPCYCRRETPSLLTCWDGIREKHSFLQNEISLGFCNLLCWVPDCSAVLICLLIRLLFWPLGFHSSL